MSIEKVKDYLTQFQKEKEVIETKTSSATVELAALALGTLPCRIAKTLSFKTEQGAILVVTAGDTKIDNKKFKETFGFKAKMLTPEEVQEFTGHVIGGVCPFAIKRDDVKTFLDLSLKRFTTVFPACGTPNSAIELTPDELFVISKADSWVDVTKLSG